ncbi:MAG TPA: glycerophosphodiester phosphodiesterase family protein [Pyrinomonadaceae bacterium]|nr:glycerophosphodiester phosphodiesterase family protein [Pyrinomonadaceae bacterium]
MSSPLILGHRGASARAPENTIAAFAQAMNDGADGIEFDVRLSSDGVPVVIHDDSLKRTASINQLVSQLTAEELRKTDVGSWLARKRPTLGQFAGEPLPLLSEVLDFFSTRAGFLYIEMKSDSQQGPLLAAAVVRLVREYQFVDRVVVESFDLPSIREVKRLDGTMRTAALFEPKLSHPLATIRRRNMVAQALEHEADEIALHHTLANKATVERARERGLDVVLWTVDEPSWIKRAQLIGIKALIANDPSRMVRARSTFTS